MLGVALASPMFAIALLASGQKATLTGTLAGQIVMEGFVNIHIRPWLRRLITRFIAIIPAVIVAAIYGERGIGNLLVFSQVILSLQLSFAVIPLVQFTSEKAKMGVFTNSRMDENPRVVGRRHHRRPQHLPARPDSRRRLIPNTLDLCRGARRAPFFFPCSSLRLRVFASLR